MKDYEPDGGDLIWTDFTPRTGREQGGRRPALVLSPKDFWRATGFVFVAPITSQIRPFPSSVVLPDGCKVSGEVLLGQTRAIDTMARPLIYAGDSVKPDFLKDARAKLTVLLGM